MNTNNNSAGPDDTDCIDNVTDLDSVRRSRSGESAEPDATASCASTGSGGAAAPAAAPPRVKNRRFDRDKVDRLKAAIAEGRYEIDAERVADKFIEHDRK